MEPYMLNAEFVMNTFELPLPIRPQAQSRMAASDRVLPKMGKRRSGSAKVAVEYCCHSLPESSCIAGYSSRTPSRRATQRATQRATEFVTDENAIGCGADKPTRPALRTALAPTPADYPAKQGGLPMSAIRPIFFDFPVQPFLRQRAGGRHAEPGEHGERARSPKQPKIYAG
jgi:hypothetical protein